MYEHVYVCTCVNKNNEPLPLKGLLYKIISSILPEVDFFQPRQKAMGKPNADGAAMASALLPGATFDASLKGPSEEGKGAGKGKRPNRRTKALPPPDGTGSEAKEENKPSVTKYNKKVSNKISTISGKLTELRCLETQVNNATLILSCIIGEKQVSNIIWEMTPNK